MGLITGADVAPFQTTTPGIGGALKQRPSDFLVDEIPLYEPSGDGEHLYLGIQKTGVAHGELLSRLRQCFKVRDHQIGYAGMKDKQAVTRQVVSVHVAGEWPDVDLGHEGINVLWSTRHINRLKRGHLRGNRFVIKVRDVNAASTPTALRTLQQLERHGVPAFFDAQRFGYRRNNQVLGACLLQGRWQEALDELLGAGGSEFPDYQRERRELYDRGAFDEAEAMWSRADRSELIAIRALMRGGGPEEAVRSIGRTTLNFLTSAWASSVFNDVLAERMRDGTLAALEDGDLAWKHDSRAVFRIDPETLEGTTIAERLERFEISPSGPLWGSDMMRAREATDARELAALARTGIGLDALQRSRYRPDGARRPLRTPIRNVEVQGGVDEHGDFVQCAFDLDRGMYATIVMREIMKN